MQKSTLLRLLITSLSASLVLMSPGFVYANHSWGGYHWARTQNPFTLKIGDNLATGWKGVLSTASVNWNSPDVFSTSSPLITAIMAGTDSRCRGVSGTVQVCNAKYGNNGWLGLASIWLSGNHITKGTTKVNDTYFNLANYNNPNEKLHVMCQEVGHTFGLDHQSTNGTSLNTCMDYFSNTGANATNTLSTTPNAHDFDELNIIYGHLDTTTTLAAASAFSPAYSRIHDADDDDWGDLIDQTKDGRGSVYEKINSDGTKILRHVYWTTEAVGNCAVCDHRYNDHGVK